MLLWHVGANNANDKRRRYNHFPADGGTRTEMGIRTILSRACEFSMARSAAKLIPNLEAPEATWICVDYQVPGAERQLGRTIAMVSYFKLLGLYPPERGGGDRRSDLVSVDVALFDAAACPIYTDDRPVFARRLLQLAHQAWVDAWNLRAAVEGSPRPRPKWPVKLWIHHQPDRLWQIAANDTLAPQPDHPRVDEALIELYPNG